MESTNLNGKVALVTGAAQGLGAAIARLFVEKGAHVVLADVLDEVGAALADRLGPSALYCHLDVSSEADWRSTVKAVIDAFGAVDVLVNNAGILRGGTIDDMSLDEYMQVITTNQVGCWLGMKTVAPFLRARGGGSIVNTASIAALTGLHSRSAYVASKFAIRGMTKVAALEFGIDKIRVNSVCPGAMDTAMLSGSAGEALYTNLPIARIGQPEEIARLVAFLASEEASYCTGAEFVVDGGLTAGPMF